MENKETKYCKYCGAEIAADSVFCEQCGKSLDNSAKNTPNNNTTPTGKPFQWSEDTVVSNNITKPELKVCRTCGADLDKRVKICPKCGASQYTVVPAKLKKCRHCGGDMAAVLKKCPHCGKPTTSNILLTTVATLIIILTVGIVAILFTAPKSKPTSNTSSKKTDNQTATAPTETPVSTAEKKELDLYSDSNVNIKYMKLFDQSDIVKGTLYLQLRVTNNSNNNVIVRLTDVSVNKMTVTSGTAVPIKIEPGNMSVSPFILFTGNTGIVKANEVNNIRFKLEMLDENFKTLHTTTTINVDL